MTSLTLEFTGGSELLVGGKEHKVTVPSAEDGVLTVRQLLDWIRHNLITERPELLIEGDTVRPGILVLVNECDWELLEQADSRLKSGDTVTFISTLHGG